MKRLPYIMLVAAILLAAAGASGRRRATPITTGATTTQAINETANDTSRINAKRRANSVSFVNDKGQTVYVDTVSGEEWMDSTLLRRVPKMEYPLFHALSVGVNVWDPLMRVFGQHHGIADAWMELSLHNRYKPIFEAGLGLANHTPSGGNYTYRSPLSFFFRVGANYNFLYNSNPDYSFIAGVRYGFAPFSYSVDNVTVNTPYWGEKVSFDIPAQHATVGWFEFCLGLRVKLYKALSAGWTVKYQTILHSSREKYGEPWYIPGYGARSSTITGSFSFIYTFGFRGANKPSASGVINDTGAEAAAETNNSK